MFAVIAPGTVLSQAYQVVRRIGAGAMGTVYEAVVLGSGERVALKVPHDIFKRDRTAIQRFLLEARATLAIRSPHVVRTLAVGRLPSGLPFYAMELVQGVSLAEYMERKDRAPVPLPAALRLIDQIAAGLSAAHQASVIHRDLKPGNVLLASPEHEPVAKLFDFGLSLLASGCDTRVTLTGTTFGTPQYMAPEQIRSARDVDARSDIYALGVMAYEMLAARWPFSGPTPQDVWHAATNFAAIPLSRHRPDLPAWLCTAVMKAMAKQPGERFDTAEQLRGVLAPHLPPSARVDCAG